MASLDYYMPLTTCEEPVDVSYLETDGVVDLSDAIACTNGWEVRHMLNRRLSQRMLAELCEEESSRFSRGLYLEGAPQGKILEHRSSTLGARWASTATWTRSIVVPQREFYHPSEGEGGPDLSTLSDRRLTVPSDGKSIRDDWRTLAIEDGPSSGEP